LGEVHVVLLGQLADQRGHVRQVIAGRLASGAGLLAAVSHVRACGGLRSLLARSLAGGRSLVLAGVLLLGLLLVLGVVLLLRLLLVLLLSLLGRLVLGLLLLRLFLLGRLAGAVADAGDDVADLDGVVFLSEDLDQGACDRGWDLGVDLVGGDLEQWLVDLDLVADGLQPLGDGALGDGLAELRHGDVLALTGTLGGGVVRRLIGRGLLGCIIGGGVLNVLVLGLLRLISLRLFFLGRLAGAVAAARVPFTTLFRAVFLSEDLDQGACDRGWDL